MHEIEVSSPLQHPNVIRVLGAVAKPRAGLVLELLSLPGKTGEQATGEEWSELGGPPSFASCTRDTYPESKRWPLPFVLRVLRGVASACAHLHASQITHADLYAHNTMVNSDGTPK
ncbi:MAG: hypothetical protein SGPRY_011844, partial [Prymnesium sp.]